MTGVASQQSVIVSLTKTIIGAGILALPFAYKCQGIVLATSTIVLAALTTSLGLLFQTFCSGFLPKGTASFFNVSRITYPSLAVVFDIAIAVKTFGVSVSYLVIIGNLMPVIAAYFNAGGLFGSRFFWLVVTMAVVGPFSFLRTLDALKYTSLIALASAAYLVVLVVAYYVGGSTIPGRGPVSVFEPESASAVLASLPIIVFAFTCAQNMFSSLNEIRNDSISQVICVVTTCTLGCAALYILTGLTGYLSFGSHVGDNIISMYPQNMLSTFGRFAIVVLVLFSYPVQLHPCRASILNITYVKERQAHVGSPTLEEAELATSDHYRTSQQRAPDSESSPLVEHSTVNDSLVVALPDAVSNFTFNSVTVIILLASFVLAVSVESLEIVLSFVGATGGTAISFILPGMFAYSLSTSSDANRILSLGPRQAVAVKCAAAALVTWGTLVLVLCLGSNIWRLTMSH